MLMYSCDVQLFLTACDVDIVPERRPAALVHSLYVVPWHCRFPQNNADVHVISINADQHGAVQIFQGRVYT
jgi:hypothetical protein